MTSKTHPTPFAALLREKMDEQHLSVHGLARRMAGVPDTTWDGVQAKETYRRKINWWLHRGVVPNEHSRQELEAALGLEPGELVPEPDDPELVLIGVLMEQLAAARARQAARKKEPA